MPDKNQQTISCARHGISPFSIVCGHLCATKDHPLGFIENNPDPDDRQAWCYDCEAKFLEEQELTPAFKEFCNIAAVCHQCYDEIKARHTVSETDLQ